MSHEYSTWLQQFNLHQKVAEVYLANSDQHFRDYVSDVTIESALALLKLPKSKQFDSRLKVTQLLDTYPVESLRGQLGVESTAKIHKFECLAIYEGKFIQAHKDTQWKYIVNVISDECLPDDPEWADPCLPKNNILYRLDPMNENGNLSRYINDARGHNQSHDGDAKAAKHNTEFITFMTDCNYPIVLVVAIKDIPAKSSVLIDYGLDYKFT